MITNDKIATISDYLQEDFNISWESVSKAILKITTEDLFDYFYKWDFVDDDGNYEETYSNFNGFSFFQSEDELMVFLNYSLDPSEIISLHKIDLNESNLIDAFCECIYDTILYINSRIDMGKYEDRD